MQGHTIRVWCGTFVVSLPLANTLLYLQLLSSQGVYRRPLCLPLVLRCYLIRSPYHIFETLGLPSDEGALKRGVRRISRGRGLRGVPGKRMDGVFPGRPQTSGRLQPRARGNGRTAEQGAGLFIAKWIVAEKARAGLRHAVVCPDVTGRTKERIAQSKRARAGSLAIVD